MKEFLQQNRNLNFYDAYQAEVEAKIKKELNIDLLVELRLAHKNDSVKILGRGKLNSALKISAHKFSASAKTAIESAGGEAVII